MKNGFILYTDYIEQVEMLEAEQVKTLFAAILRYASGMDLPEMDLPTRLVFSYFKTLNKKDRGKAGRKSIEYANGESVYLREIIIHVRCADIGEAN